MRMTGSLPAGGVCSQLCTTMDLLPTFALMAGAHAPTDRTIDGQDIRPVISCEPGATSPCEAFYYYHMEQLHAVRSGNWKLHLPRTDKRTFHRDESGETPALLYDVVQDPGETTDLAAQQPQIVARLTELAEAAREELGDTDRPGKGLRPAGHFPHPTPRVKA
jgi:arylsulfatase A-like enzyme